MGSDVGKTILSSDRLHKGIITKESERYCAVCGWHSCYIVRWDDGTMTKPCTAGVSYDRDSILIIDQ